MKILIVRLSSIGDVLLTTPVVRCIKQQVGEVEIHFLTRKSNAAILNGNPHIDVLHCIENSPDEIVSTLQSERFDLVVDLHNVPRTRRLRRKLDIKTLVYNKENLHKFIYILTKHNCMSGKHVVERYADAVKPLGVALDSEGLEMYLPPQINWPETFGHIFGASSYSAMKPFVAVACGAQHYTKQIPVEGIVEICKHLRHKALLLGDNNDRQRLSTVADLLPSNAYNLCGLTSLQQSAAVVRDAAVVITPDTGLMHMAAAFRRPTLAVWGATAPPLGFTPYHTFSENFEVSPLPCHPCSRQGNAQCRKGHFRCMAEQDWHKIANRADDIIDKQ